MQLRKWVRERKWWAGWGISVLAAFGSVVGIGGSVGLALFIGGLVFANVCFVMYLRSPD